MELECYEFRDPAELIEELAKRATLHEGTAWLARVEDASTVQRIISVEPLATTNVSGGWKDASAELRTRIRTWQVPSKPPVRTSAVLVVVRRGLCVMGRREYNWHLAWRYVNHARLVFSGDLILVTEHGWVDSTTHRGGPTPALVEQP